MRDNIRSMRDNICGTTSAGQHRESARLGAESARLPIEKQPKLKQVERNPKLKEDVVQEHRGLGAHIDPDVVQEHPVDPDVLGQHQGQHAPSLRVCV